MESLLLRVTSQLDALVPFLSIAHSEVFDLVSGEYESWCNGGEHVPFPDTFEAFTSQIAHSAFVLGYSYFDAFLADLMREIYRSQPKILPLKKTLSFQDILGAGDYSGVLKKMIDNEVYEAMHGSILQIQRYYNDKFDILWPSVHLGDLETASLIRNCIVHNNALVDQKLAQKTGWEFGSRIKVSIEDVHRYGIAIRDVVDYVYNDAKERHLNR